MDTTIEQSSGDIMSDRWGELKLWRDGARAYGLSVPFGWGGIEAEN